MATVLISNLAPINEKEKGGFLDLFEAFRVRGCQSIFWSCVYHKEFAPYYIPMNWRIKLWSDYYKNLSVDLEAAYGLIDRNKWLSRVNQLCKQEWTEPSRQQLLDIIVSTSYKILTTFEPDLFLCWNTLCPHVGVAHDMCLKIGISSVLLERGVLPDTWFLEPGGLVGHSVIAGKPLSELVDTFNREIYRDIGRKYIENNPFAQFNKYTQVKRSQAMETLKQSPWVYRRPRIVLFPPDDGTLGFEPADGQDRIKTLPNYRSSFDAAKQLAHSCEGIVIFKPHPSFLEHKFDTEGISNLFVIDFDFRNLINWSDIVASTGSGLEFVAMAMGKPVVLMANDILKGKGVAYEALSAEELPGALEDAFFQKDFNLRQKNFWKFLGYLLVDYLLSFSDSHPKYRTPTQGVDMLCTAFLNARTKEASIENFLDKRQEIISDEWAARLSVDPYFNTNIKKSRNLHNG